jgi:subtilisin-like proprotein convertase family protein
MASPMASAQVNGGFENGNLGSWTASSGVEVLQAANFSPAITPPEGTYFALLSSGPGIQGRPTGDIDGNGATEYDITTLSRTFTTTGPGQTLSFRWAFLTAEQFENNQYDDVIEVSVDGPRILGRSVNKPGGDSPFPDSPPYSGNPTTVTSGGSTNNSSFGNGSSGFSDYCIAIADAGTYTIQFRVADQADQQFDSGLLIDDFQAPSTCTGTTQITNTTADVSVELKGGGIDVRTAANGSAQGGPAMTAGDGTVQVFASSANLTGDNPSAQLQVVTWDGIEFERLTTMVDGVAGRGDAAPSGRWLTYAATDDPLGANADLNLEIFRHDRVLDQTMQVTSTSGCDNTTPSISDLGGRIAFVTNCSNLSGGFNGDGNSEVVVWDQSTGFHTRETSGCDSADPDLAGDGRYVAFSSSCNLTGGNGDHNNEIFRWDMVTTGVQQLTNSTTPLGSTGPSIDRDGSVVAFISAGNLTGSNPANALEIFTWDNGALDQLTNGGVLAPHLTTTVDPTGEFVSGEKLDALIAQTEIFFIERATDVLTPVAAGDVRFPVLSVDGDQPTLIYESSDDPVGQNPDGNTEVFRSVGVFRPPVNQCSTVNVAIPDDSSSGVSRTMTITPSRTITDVDVGVVIDHSYVGDLVVTLTHVDTGTSVRVINRITRNSTPGTCYRDNIDAILDDEGARDVYTECPGVTPTVESPPSFTPDQALSAFDGESTAGTWRLNVADVDRGQTGTFRSWCLYFQAN